MKIRWEDIGRVEKPGDYPFRGGILTVRLREIAIWKEHPDAIYNVVEFTPLSGPKRYALGTCEYED